MIRYTIFFLALSIIFIPSLHSHSTSADNDFDVVLYADNYLEFETAQHICPLCTNSGNLFNDNFNIFSLYAPSQNKFIHPGNEFIQDLNKVKYRPSRAPPIA